MLCSSRSSLEQFIATMSTVNEPGCYAAVDICLEFRRVRSRSVGGVSKFSRFEMTESEKKVRQGKDDRLHTWYLLLNNWWTVLLRRRWDSLRPQREVPERV